MAQKSPSTSRGGKAGTAIVWFRNDLRVHDNEALWKACEGAESVVPLYCFDPRHFEKTQHFEFAKTGGKSPLPNCHISPKLFPS